MRLLSATALICLLAPVGFSQNSKSAKDDPSKIGDRDIGKCLNFYPLDKEMALGAELDREVQRQSKVVEDPLITEFINRMGQNLVRNSDAKFPFVFRVIQSDEVNAYTLPGGYVYVYTGLIKFAAEEDELAGAMAHEIAHAAARHLTCRASKEQIAKIASVPLIFLGGLPGYAIRQGADAALPMGLMAFSRHDESEADYLGLQYMYAAGYDPNGAVSMFEKLESLQKTRQGAVSRLFNSHPIEADRIDRTEKEIQKILPPRDNYVVTTSEFTGIRERLLRMDNGRKPTTDRPQLIRRNEDSPDKDQDSPRPTIKRKEFEEQ